MSLVTGILAVISGYLLGSIPSAYLIGRLRGIDFTVENGNARLGTSLAYHRLGIVWGLVVALTDFGKGVMTIAIARMLGVSEILLLLAGFAAVAGHNWSIFIGFKGGRGAMVSYGVLASLALWGFIAAMALAGILLFFTRKSTLATVILLVVLVIILWIQGSLHFPPALPWEQAVTPWLVIFPLTLLIPIFLKYAQIRKQRKSGIV